MFNYSAKCGWLFDGFFSHGQLAVELIVGLGNSTIGPRFFASVDEALGRPPRGQGPGPGRGSPRPQRHFRKSFD